MLMVVEVAAELTKLVTGTWKPESERHIGESPEDEEKRKKKEQEKKDRGR